MEENEVLSRVSDAVLQQAVTFEIDILPGSRMHAWLQRIGWLKRKRGFEIRPLTLGQLQKVSKLIISINADLVTITSDAVLKMMIEHTRTCAEIVAIAVTPSRHTPSKALIDMFFHNLSKEDMSLALQIVLQQMNVTNFIITIISIRNLSINQAKKKPADAKSVENVGMNPEDKGSQIAPGILSEV